MGRGVAAGWGRGRRRLRVVAEWPGSRGTGGRGGPRRPAQRRRPGQGHTAPALTHSQDRPEARRSGRPRVGPGRSASVSRGAGLGRAGPGRAGRGRGPRAARAAGRQRRAGPSYLWKETARFSPLPCRLEQFAAAQQITISGLRPQRRRQAPALASPRRAPSGTAPRGGRAATRLRDVGAGPAAPAVRQDGGARRSAARPPGPALGAPGIPDTGRGAAHRSRRRGWAGAPRAGGAVRRHGGRGASVRQDGRAGGPARATGSRARPGALLPARGCFRGPDGSLLGLPGRTTQAAEEPIVRARAPCWVRRTPRWRRRTSVAHFRPRPSPCPLVPDWPRWRPVASRCGTVGATPRSVGGPSGKMDAATLTYDTLRFAEFEDFPETSEPVWILGRKYSIFTEKDEILADVASRLWFTYRKNFPAIGGTGPTSDAGWGCMLRCGQMIFAQALVCRHLGRDWRWTQRKRQPDSYFSVLNAFVDRKDSYYSIHQIAQMGVGEGKSVGQWYGPNTVAQVLKKLAVFDTWSALAVHIAMDNTVVMEDIRKLCRSSLPCAGAAAFPADSEQHCNGFPAGAEVSSRTSPSPWRPLVLLIPLRLGLTDINSAYTETLKHCFMMPQSLGVIGGKPNSAHYFIGYVGEELIYLDPHTTQPAVQVTDSCLIPDESFHCQHPPSRMNISELDPSIAVGFFCKTEDDFNDWCQQVKKLSLLGGALPMFELVEQQPSHLACPDVLNLSLDSSDVERLERFFDSEDEDFEILSL